MRHNRPSAQPPPHSYPMQQSMRVAAQWLSACRLRTVASVDQGTRVCLAQEAGSGQNDTPRERGHRRRYGQGPQVQLLTPLSLPANRLPAEPIPPNVQPVGWEEKEVRVYRFQSLMADCSLNNQYSYPVWPLGSRWLSGLMLFFFRTFSPCSFCTGPTSPGCTAIAWLPVMHAWYVTLHQGRFSLPICVDLAC